MERFIKQLDYDFELMSHKTKILLDEHFPNGMFVRIFFV